MQRAYRDKYNRRPIEDGIDVINVRGLSAKRFLDLAVPLGRRVAVINDNDGNFTKNVWDKYENYQSYDFISIHASDNDDLKTLEPQVVASAGLGAINRALGTSFTSDEEASDYMIAHKTGVALALHDTTETLNWPTYIQDAVNGIR